MRAKSALCLRDACGVERRERRVRALDSRDTFALGQAGGRTVAPGSNCLVVIARDHEGACTSLDDGRTLYCYRGDSLPAMPSWLALAPPAPVTPWRFARCVVLFAVLLVIIALCGVRDMLRRATGRFAIRTKP